MTKPAISESKPTEARVVFLRSSAEADCAELVISDAGGGSIIYRLRSTQLKRLAVDATVMAIGGFRVDSPDLGY
jgi:hypothetical protein